MYGSIEAGGTKFVCAIGNDDLKVLERVSFPTTTPNETMSLVIDFFNHYKEQLESIGVGSFGPLISIVNQRPMDISPLLQKLPGKILILLER